uniref:Uncharacterized protein n=1 Tax=Tanacetum cinerariifolium TaxID=118510 RepID=A0A6L2NDI7_TANCI|nr:hypothetical protein [Tanacetum cinerariifolium]
MEILLEPTSNKLMVGDLCDSMRIKLVTTGKKRWRDSIRIKLVPAGNPVKEILLKLNLPYHRSILMDRRILKDGGEGTCFQLSQRFIAACSYPTNKYKDIMKAQKDALLKLFKLSNQERYEHVGPKSQVHKQSSQDGEKRLCLVDDFKDEWNSNIFGEWLNKNSTVGKHVVVIVDAIKAEISKRKPAMTSSTFKSELVAFGYNREAFSVIFGLSYLEDVPLEGEVDESMENPCFNEEEELDEFMNDDEDVLDEDEEWLIAPVTPLKATVTVLSTYEVGGPSMATSVGHTLTTMASKVAMQPQMIDDLCVRMSNLKYRHGELVKKMVKVSDAEVANNITIGEIHPRVATMEEHVQVMASQAVQVTVVPRQDVIVGLSQQVQTLQKALHGAELQNQQLRTRVAEMESREAILMSYMRVNAWRYGDIIDGFIVVLRLVLIIGLGVADGFWTLVSTADVSIAIEMVNTVGLKARDKGKALMQESEPTKKIKMRIQVQMSIDEELTWKLHEEELTRFNCKQEAIDIAR